MTTKEQISASIPMSFLSLGRERTEAAIALQEELLAAYQQASRAWVDRVKSEVELWSDLAAKLGATRTVPEALEASTKCASQRMHMAAEDGLRLFNEGQEIVQKINRSLSNGRPKASS